MVNEGLKGRFSVEAYDSKGRLKFSEKFNNLVVDSGIVYALNAAFDSGTQAAAQYIGLTDSTPTVAAGDTMSSHAGWVEVTSYSEANRPVWDKVLSGKTFSNSANKAQFSITATVTIGGAFITTDNTKGGSTGTLIAAGAFSTGDKSLDNGDTLFVQYDFSATDDGV